MAKLDDPAGPYSAIILAKAGMVRLGFGARLTADLPPPTLFHAVGQGALGVEIRTDDAEAAALCAALTHWETHWACAAERAMLRVLEGGCSVPVGVHSTLAVQGERRATLRLAGTITALDGSVHIQQELAGPVTNVEEAEDIGARLAKMLIDNGGRTILDDIGEDRARRAADAEDTEGEVSKTSAFAPVPPA
jgi:hydroxymethylbilane synthase